jgi:hypothetical protein
MKRKNGMIGITIDMGKNRPTMFMSILTVSTWLGYKMLWLPVGFRPNALWIESQKIRKTIKLVINTFK